MASLTSQKSAPLLVVLLAGLVGYIAYTGAVVDTLGVSGLAARKQQVVAIEDTIARLGGGHRQRQGGAGARHGRGPPQAARDLSRQPGASPPPGARAQRGAQPPRRYLQPRQDPRGDAVAGGAAAGGAGPGAVRHLQVQHVGHRPTTIRSASSSPTWPACSASSCRTISRVAPTNNQSAKALGDTSGSLLEAKFQVRTYVKSSSPEGEASGT